MDKKYKRIICQCLCENEVSLKICCLSFFYDYHIQCTNAKQKIHISVLIVLRELVGTFWALIKYRGTFIDTSQLHCVKVKLRMVASGAIFFDCCVFDHFFSSRTFIFSFVCNPSGLCCGSTLRYHLRSHNVSKLAREGAMRAFNHLAIRRIQNSTTNRAKRPRHRNSY